MFHTIQEFSDEKYIELRKDIVTRKDFFREIVFVTKYFVFKNYDKMVEFMLLSQNDEDIDMGIYVDI